MDEIAALVQRLAATAPLNAGVRRSAYACPTPAVREPGRRGPHSQLSAKKSSREKVILRRVISRRLSGDSLRAFADLLAFVFTRLVVRRTRLARVDRYPQRSIASGPLVGDTAP